MAQRELASRVDQRVLDGLGTWREWLSTVSRRASTAEVSGLRVRSRPRLGYMCGVKVALNSRGMPTEAAQQCSKDRKDWRALVHM